MLDANINSRRKIFGRTAPRESACFLLTIASVFLSHINIYPQSDPDTTYSLLGP